MQQWLHGCSHTVEGKSNIPHEFPGQPTRRIRRLVCLARLPQRPDLEKRVVIGSNSGVDKQPIECIDAVNRHFVIVEWAVRAPAQRTQAGGYGAQSRMRAVTEDKQRPFVCTLMMADLCRVWWLVIE